MKRTAFGLIGLSVLMSLALVSCEDKLTNDDNKSSGEGQGEESQYRTVQDSVFTYYNGQLQSVQYQFFDSTGNIIRDLKKRYDNDGSLTINSETYYIYSDEDGRNYTSYTNNHGFSCDRKVEFNIIGSDNNVNSTQKEYVNYEGEWLLVRENYSQRDRNAGLRRSISYGLYNNNLIVLSRSEAKTTYNSVTGMISRQETDSYNSNYFRTSDITIIESILSLRGIWTREIINYDSDGRSLSSLRMQSSDSIDWKEEAKSEYKYDYKGNMIIEELSYINEKSRNLWTYDNNNRLLKEEYYEWSEKDSKYILCGNVNYIYSYSASGVLAAVEINSESNSISLPIIIEDGKMPSILDRRRSMSAATSQTRQPAGAKCSIICDSNGNPTSETLYCFDSEGNLAEYGKCKLEYDSKGNCLNLNYVVVDDRNKVENRRTFDSWGNLLTSYNYSYNFSTRSDSYYSYNGYLTITYTSEAETESRQENRYDELGFISYSYSSSKSHTHYVSSNGRDEENNSDSRQEVYFSTIKVK